MRVRKVAKDGKMKAVVSITLDDEFVVHDIKVIEGEKGLFIAMPSRKASDGEYRDIAHPINSETRERIQTIILEQYEKAAAESAEAEEAATEKRTGDTAENCSYAYLRYLFARLYLTTLGNYAMVILLEQFYSFRDYGSLPGDGFILGPHIIPMRTKSKEARGGCVWNPCVCRRGNL